MSNAQALTLMVSLFLVLGYTGVPVTFALLAGVLAAAFFTPVSLQSMVGQLFHGIDSQALLAIPFFLLIGELLVSSAIVHRVLRLVQALVGHLRGGMAQVVTVFSMLFAGISGSAVADVAVLSRTVAPKMAQDGYDRAFTAALIASASTIAQLIPPSILAIVYASAGNVSVGGLFLAGVVPGLMIGAGLMVYSFFASPSSARTQRAPLSEVRLAARAATLPMLIPFIILGGIFGGWFTPTEAGVAAIVYILLVLILVYKPRHLLQLPADFVNAGLLYALPLSAIAAASAFGWMVAYLRGPDIVAAHIIAYAGTDGLTILLMLVLVFIIVGDFLDAIPAIIIFMPIINKLTETGNIAPLHMGVVVITTLAFGLITPPYGLSMLVASKYVGVGFGRAVVRSLPMYSVFLVTIGVIVFFPQVVLWLPKWVNPEWVGCFKHPDGLGYICP